MPVILKVERCKDCKGKRVFKWCEWRQLGFVIVCRLLNRCCFHFLSWAFL